MGRKRRRGLPCLCSSRPAVSTFPGYCVAPAGYAGSCSPLMDFSGHSADSKMRLAASCGFQWPCAVRSQVGPSRLKEGVSGRNGPL